MIATCARPLFVGHILTFERVIVSTATTPAVVLVVKLLDVHWPAHGLAAVSVEAGCT